VTDQLINNVRFAAERALRENRISTLDVQSLLKVYKESMAGMTYLEG
jgi:hypothetical protein